MALFGGRPGLELRSSRELLSLEEQELVDGRRTGVWVFTESVTHKGWVHVLTSRVLIKIRVTAAKRTRHLYCKVNVKIG